MISNLALRKGDTLRTISPCGGGYGDPLEREPASVLNDFRDGLISGENAVKQYKVAINQLGAVDEIETARLRR
jgi:N-methylhydantoinase B